MKDESLRKFNTVYPAAGNGHTAVKLTLQELEAAAGAEGWVDVCKEPEGESYNKRKGSSARTFVRDRTPFLCFINLSAKWVAFAGQQEKRRS